MTIDPLTVGEGTAILIMGVMAVSLAAAFLFKNYLATAAWGFSLLALIFVFIFSLPLEVFWLSVALTLVLVIAGVAIRI